MIHRIHTTSLLLLLALAAGGCGSHRMSITPSEYGSAGDTPVTLYTLQNSNGLICKITNYGAIITELHVPDRHGELDDIVLGYDELDRYLARHPYFGCIVGRCANRIAGGQFTIDGTPYTLATNNGPNALHGGERGFDRKVWDAEPMLKLEGPALKLTYESPDGEEGYPGNLSVEVVYTLTNFNELKVEMTARTDKPTVVNLAQHTYWNLAGHDSGTVGDHVLKLYASKFTPADDHLIPTGEIKDVKGTPYDFTEPTPIGKHINVFTDGFTKENRHPSGGGFDVNYMIDGEAGRMRPVAEVYEPDSGRVVELVSGQPAVQFYTGNWLDAEAGKGGATYEQHAGFCLETQHVPDAINQPEKFTAPLLKPGERYRHVMIFRFSARQP